MSAGARIPVSTGSAHMAFDKLHGAKNKNMRTVLLSLSQWGLITGTVKAPTPADSARPTVRESSAIGAFEVRSMSAFMDASQLRQIRSRQHRGSQSRLGVAGEALWCKAAWPAICPHGKTSPHQVG